MNEKLISLLLLLANSLFLANLSEAWRFEPCSLKANRLPTLVVPDRYNITLEPDLKSMKFEGHVDIQAKYTGDMSGPKVTFLTIVKEVCKNILYCGIKRNHDIASRRIVLNMGSSLHLDDVKVFKIDQNSDINEDHESIYLDEVCIDRENQLLSITLAKKLSANDKILISIDYHGSIPGNESRGIYRSLDEGLDVNNRPEVLTNVNTHFFPADARTTFPCFDQPDLKANFNLKLIHDKDLQSISNSEVLSSEINDQKKIVVFGETPKMSSYLLSFAIGSYDTITCQAEGLTRPIVTAYAPVGRSAEAQFTLDTVCKAIPAIESYLNEEFPLKKLDLVVTKQMREPARENWGMLVFTEDFLLTNQDTTNILRVEIAKLAVHVVLHHWIGDLVTAKWWDDQWIFDGFTIWRSHWAAATIYPEFNYEFNYLLRLQSPMLDAHVFDNSVHPIKTYQDLTANQELALFDANTYNKAGALYQMLNAKLGEYVFRDALVKFVDNNAYDVGTAQSFTDAIEQASGLQLNDMIRSWTDQAGVPLVSVDRAGRSELELHQERFGENLNVEQAKQTWIIPIDILFSDGVKRKEVVRTSLNSSQMKVQAPAWFDNFNPTHWLKLNINFNSLYRVNYSSTQLNRLQAPIEQKLLSPQDRFNIIDDLRALVKMNKLTTKAIVEVLDWYREEDNGGVLSGLVSVVQVLSERESRARCKEIVERMFKHVHESSGFKLVEGQGYADMNGRQDALMQLINYKFEPAINEALEVFDNSDVHLIPFLRKPVYLAVLTSGSEDQVNKLIERLGQTSSLYEREILVSSLVPYVTSDESLKNRLKSTLTA